MLSKRIHLIDSSIPNRVLSIDHALSIYLFIIYLFIYLFIFVSMVAAASIGYPAFYSIYYFQQQNNFAERWLYNLLDVHRFELI